ncbi:MAG: malic enzyme [Gammaproteobacteria bacterium]|nr:MAG: malic enzyme [Gammaproteobacteria bacterium]
MSDQYQYIHNRKGLSLNMADKKLTAEELKQAALHYHTHPVAGKTATALTKACDTQEDLSLAYTPGVAAPVRAIAEDPEAAYHYTNKGNLVAVVTDGSAVLGLGNVGALAGKPVMEGKAVLFKKFANIDVMDIEVNADSVEDFVKTVKNISPTFGGINLEDIAAPRCFEIEKALIEELNIPVFHDDQHGTAIIIAAGLLNALEITGREIEKAHIVCLGAGAAGIAAMRMLKSLGARKIYLVDRKGVVYNGREEVNKYKHEFSRESSRRTLSDAMKDADVFIGVSGPNLLKPEMLETMAANPIVFALSNPDPEINPELAKKTRNDIILATGRSDYPNQVNNVLGFPFIFRGALDVRATCINTEMQIAAVKALAALTKEETPQSVLDAYGVDKLEFGKDYIIPKPFDSRLQDFVPKAVAEAAIDTGVAKDR